MAQSRMTGLASLPLTTNEPPTLISWKVAASVPGVADRFPIAGPPSEKFAVRYAPAPHSTPNTYEDSTLSFRAALTA